MFITLVLLQLFLVVNTQEGKDCQTPDHQSGICIPPITCKTMQDYLNKFSRPIPPKIVKKLLPYQCSTTSNGRGRPKICCPTKPIPYENQDQEWDQNSEYPDVTNHRNIKLLPKDCGYAIVDKIYYSSNFVGLFQFRWMALLSYRDGNTLDYLCGGTIVNERYILTAAHCVTNLGKLQLVGVRVGEYNIRTEKDCEIDVELDEEVCAPPVQDLSIEQVIFHQNYSSRSLAHDIALIRVSPIDLSQENIQPVCLPVGSAQFYDYRNRYVVVTGWGATKKGSKSPILRQADLPYVPLEECQKKFRNIKLFKSQLCAGGMSINDSCTGDSGGPLHALSFLYDQPRLVQRGIVSYGPEDCGKWSLPVIYTRVVSYIDWILDNMKP